MKKKTDIWLYVLVGSMCAALLLVIATAVHCIVNTLNEYERGYMDGFGDGMLMNMDYGTIKLERKGGGE